MKKENWEDKKYYYFRRLPKDLVSKIKIDKVSSYSVTELGVADKMSRILLKNPLISKESVILDGMACIGGNTISFCRNFNQVYCVEIDSVRFNYLNSNLRILGLENVTSYNGSILDYYKNIKSDILFLDPEWGGPDYDMKKKINVYINNIAINEFCKMIMDSISPPKVISLKLPKNYDLDLLKNNIDRKIEIFDLKKMFLVNIY
tara:strand:+ start:770 stop:1381 length:612 start_codon:yes stop_codon:yes gene_type:complete